MSEEEAAALCEEEADESANVVWVWKQNWNSVRVFVNCSWTRVATAEKLIPTGIAAAEIEAVCRLMQIPPRKWPQIIADCRCMQGVALPELTR